MIGELRKTKTFLHARMGSINIKQAKKFRVLCPNYNPSKDENSTLIDAEEEDDGIIRVIGIPDSCCPCHERPLPSDQYTWLIQNVLCKYIHDSVCTSWSISIPINLWLLLLLLLINDFENVTGNYKCGEVVLRRWGTS